MFWSALRESTKFIYDAAERCHPRGQVTHEVRLLDMDVKECILTSESSYRGFKGARRLVPRWLRCELYWRREEFQAVSFRVLCSMREWYPTISCICACAMHWLPFPAWTRSWGPSNFLIEERVARLGRVALSFLNLSCCLSWASLEVHMLLFHPQGRC